MQGQQRQAAAIGKRWRSGIIVALGCLAAGGGVAQEAGVEPFHGHTPAMPVTDARPLVLGDAMPLVSIDLGASGRTSRSLRIRFDSATRAMRGLGVEAEDCVTVLRSKKHRVETSPGHESIRLGVSLALNCRFF